MTCGCCCAIGFAFVAVLIGALQLLYSGSLAESGALAWLDSWNPNGRGLRWRGEFPFLTPRPWHFTPQDIPNLLDQTAIVTGGHSGLGYWTAAHMMQANATVVITCRSMKKCQQACYRMGALPFKKDKDGYSAVRHVCVPMVLDLASCRSIREFAMNFSRKFPELDSLVLNAGVMQQPFQLTREGLESTMGVNHFGHFVLTKVLLPRLQAAVVARGVARVSVSSSASMFETSHLTEGILPQYLEPVENPEDNATWYDPRDAHVQSKLANVLFAQELSKRVKSKGILVNAYSPGMVNTPIWEGIIGKMSEKGPIFRGGGLIEDKIGEWARFVLFKYIMPLHKFLWHPNEASLTPLYTATAAELKSSKTTGKYFQPVARMMDPDPHCNNESLQELLWQRSETFAELNDVDDIEFDLEIEKTNQRLAKKERDDKEYKSSPLGQQMEGLKEQVMQIKDEFIKEKERRTNVAQMGKTTTTTTQKKRKGSPKGPKMKKQK